MQGENILTKYSNVFSTSNIDLTPEQTTATGVCPSSTKSVLISKVCSAPRWTPPIPPVAIMGKSDKFAINIVALTVVPPFSFWATTVDISLREHLIVLIESDLASVCSCSLFKPTCICPFKIPIVAGTAP